VTTTYRVIVHCNDTLTGECHGMVEFTTPELQRLAQHADIVAKGWLRAYAATQTYDTCPECAKVLQKAERRKQVKAEAEPEAVPEEVEAHHG
jgi:uncharacterized protein with PIN domain